MCHSRPIIPVIPHEVTTLSVHLLAYVFCILLHLLLLLSLYPYELIYWWWCHYGGILPLYGRGKVVYEHVFGTTQAMREIILKGEEVYDILGGVWKLRFPQA